MASSTFLLLAVIGSLGLVSCQFDRDFNRERERERNSRGNVRIADGCVGKVMDIFFVLDSSSSIYINDYMSQHRVTRDIISRFDVSAESTRVGMLTFSDDIERPVVGINRYSNKNELLNAISMQSLPYRTGVTNTDQAIRYVRQISDFREDITKVIVVMTDGGSRSPGNTAREAELARAAGFYLYVIGIGQYLEEREWRSIASDPDDTFIYNITNPRFMEDVKFSMPPRACALPPIILEGSCDVTRLSEVYFVASRSATDRAVDIIDNFKRRSRDDRDNLRVSYLIEACGSVANAVLDDEDVVCDRFASRTGDTAESVNALFSRAQTIARQSRQESPRDVNQIIVLFADEETMSLARHEWATKARSAESIDSVTVVVVNLGLRAYRDFAQRMAGNNRNNYIVFTGGSVQNQTNAQKQLIDAVCAGVNKGGPDFNARPV